MDPLSEIFGELQLNSSAITTLNQDVHTLSGATDAAITTFKQEFHADTSAILRELQVNITTLRETINANSSAITTFKQEFHADTSAILRELQVTITTLRETINANSSAITTLSETTKVYKFSDDITGFQNKVPFEPFCEIEKSDVADKEGLNAIDRDRQRIAENCRLASK